MQSPHLNRSFLLIAFAALAVAGCTREPEPPAGVISRDKFVAANVALRTLSDSAPQARRDAALKKAGVTDRQLRAWVTAYSRQPETMAKAWEEIAFKVDSIGGSRPMPQGDGPPPPPGVVGIPMELPALDSMGRPMRDSLTARRRRPVPMPRERNMPPAPATQQ